VTATTVVVPFLAQSIDSSGRSGRTALYSSCQDVGGVARFDTCTANVGLTELGRNANATVPLSASDLAGGGLEVTYFANIALTQSWETVSARIGYSRSASNQGGFSTSSVLDAVTGTVTWQPTELWTIALTALWSQRESVSKGIDPNLSKSLFVSPFFFSGATEAVTASQSVVLRSRNINVQNYLVSLRVDRRIWKRLTVYGSFLYNYQNQGDTFQTASGSYDAKRINLGVRYEFDPIQLF
jgi:hypothetical protein